MSAFDKWEIAGVLPGDYEDYGNWVLQMGNEIFSSTGGGIVYHKHLNPETQKLTLMMIDTRGMCRYCGVPAPLGIIFRARTAALDEV
jgi:hypothetical protein